MSCQHTDLKQQIRQCIEAILNYLLECAKASLPGERHECRGGDGGDGGHLKDVVSNADAYF
jgi:hypothetical protein